MNVSLYISSIPQCPSPLPAAGLAGLLGVEQVADVHGDGLGVVQAALLLPPRRAAQGAAAAPGAALLGRWVGGLLRTGDVTGVWVGS